MTIIHEKDVVCVLSTPLQGLPASPQVCHRSYSKAEQAWHFFFCSRLVCQSFLCFAGHAFWNTSVMLNITHFEFHESTQTKSEGLLSTWRLFVCWNFSGIQHPAADQRCLDCNRGSFSSYSGLLSEWSFVQTMLTYRLQWILASFLFFLFPDPGDNLASGPCAFRTLRF